MPDFDQFERLLKDAVGRSDYERAAREISERMAALTELEKVKLIKGRSSPEIEGFLVRAAIALRANTTLDGKFTGSFNNLLGKDLRETRTGMEVELKSGSSMTDSGNGLEIVGWALDDHAEPLQKIMRDGMFERRKMLEAGASPVEIERHKARSMDALSAYFLTRYAPGDEARPRLSHFLRCISVGLTKGKEIREFFERFGEARLPLMLQADWDKGLVPYAKAFLSDERLSVERIERSAIRAQMIVVGDQSRRTAKLYPNFKNGWTSRARGKRFGAENWIETACFHVWIT